jgi:parallel beta-helix repeat protein
MHRTFNLEASIRVALVLAASWVLQPPVVTADDLCGATVVSNLTLHHDLTCAGDGLIVGADGIKLNLNGHTITGPGTAPGSGFGINVVGRNNVSIFGGTVKNFTAGVRVNNSTGIVVKENTLLENGDGIDLQAGTIGNTIKENEFWNNSTRGIMLRGGATHNVIKENTFTGNRVGILVFGGVENTLKENILSASSLAAIRLNVIATGNLIVENVVVSNPTGIDFIVTATGTSTGNTLIENTIAMNTCGLKGPIAGNTFEENIFQGNGTDSCP